MLVKEVSRIYEINIERIESMRDEADGSRRTEKSKTQAKTARYDLSANAAFLETDRVALLRRL